MGIETAALVLSIASTAYSVYESEEAKDDAEDRARLEEEQTRLAQQQEEIRARRQARIRQAQIVASGAAAGVGGSIVEAPTIGTRTSLETGLNLLEKQTASQVAQIGAELKSTKAGLTAQQIKGVSGVVGGALDLSQELKKPKLDTTLSTGSNFTDPINKES